MNLDVKIVILVWRGDHVRYHGFYLFSYLSVFAGARGEGDNLSVASFMFRHLSSVVG